MVRRQRCPCDYPIEHHATKMYGETELQRHQIWPQYLIGMSGQFHAPAALPLRKEKHYIHWIGGWVDPGVGLDDVKKRRILPHAGNRTQVDQQVACRYTDRAIPAHKSTGMIGDDRINIFKYD
jgi:hypothetical protein